MPIRLALAVLVLFSASFSLEAATTGPSEEKKTPPEEKKDQNASVEPSPRFLSEEEIQASLRPNEKILHIQSEVILFRVEPVRFFPLVGNARLVLNRYKYIVDTDQGQWTLYVDRDYLIPVD